MSTRDTVIAVCSVAIAVVGLGWMIYSGNLSLKLQIWTAQKDALETCYLLRDIDKHPKFCNQTIDHGFEAPPAVKRDADMLDDRSRQPPLLITCLAAAVSGFVLGYLAAMLFSRCTHLFHQAVSLRLSQSLRLIWGHVNWHVFDWNWSYRARTSLERAINTMHPNVSTEGTNSTTIVQSLLTFYNRGCSANMDDFWELGEREDVDLHDDGITGEENDTMYDGWSSSVQDVSKARSEIETFESPSTYHVIDSLCSYSNLLRKSRDEQRENTRVEGHVLLQTSLWNVPEHTLAGLSRFITIQQQRGDSLFFHRGWSKLQVFRGVLTSMQRFMLAEQLTGLPSDRFQILILCLIVELVVVLRSQRNSIETQISPLTDGLANESLERHQMLARASCDNAEYEALVAVKQHITAIKNRQKTWARFWDDSSTMFDEVAILLSRIISESTSSESKKSNSLMVAIGSTA